MIKISNLKVSNNGNTIIENASLEAVTGEAIVIEGANGSGKSSLLSAIFKNPEYKIESGVIELEGEDITSAPTHEMIKKGMYLGLQNVPEISGATNLKLLYQFYKNVHGDKLPMLDFKKNLEKLCDKFDLNKDFLKREINVGFSGGEKKQVELLHILSVMPKVIFLDEPDSGVDKEAVKKVFSVMSYMIDNGSIVIFTSHLDNFFDLKIAKVYEIKDKICKIK